MHLLLTRPNKSCILWQSFFFLIQIPNTLLCRNSSLYKNASCVYYFSSKLLFVFAVWEYWYFLPIALHTNCFPSNGFCLNCSLSLLFQFIIFVSFIYPLLLNITVGQFDHAGEFVQFVQLFPLSIFSKV